MTLAFLFPFFPDDMLCILAGLTSLSFRRFTLIVLLARPWGLLFASALGGATLGMSPWVMVPVAVFGLALFLLGLKYGDKVEEMILGRLKKRGIKIQTALLKFLQFPPLQIRESVIRYRHNKNKYR